jgi:hypothetical protein
MAVGLDARVARGVPLPRLASTNVACAPRASVRRRHRAAGRDPESCAVSRRSVDVWDGGGTIAGRSQSAWASSPSWQARRRPRATSRGGWGCASQGTRRLLDVLVAAGHLRLTRDERYRLAPRAAKWLDPRSGRYVGDVIADTAGFWDWWGGLEALVRDGRSVEMHDRPADDPFWRTYILGQYELARLASKAVAKAVRLPRHATSVLDVAGGHGEYAMADLLGLRLSSRETGTGPARNGSWSKKCCDGATTRQIEDVGCAGWLIKRAPWPIARRARPDEPLRPWPECR